MSTIKVTHATIAKLGLAPGDVIVLRVTDKAIRVTAEKARLLKEELAEAFPGYQAVVLTYGLDIEKITLGGNMIPTSEDARKAGEAAGSSFWLIVIGVWLVLFAVAVTLGLALAIWNLIGAF